MTISHEPFNPAGKSMLTDPTEQAGLPWLAWLWGRVYPGMGHGGRGRKTPTLERA